ncbi:DUF1722 domain-containing protein [Natronospirillum operosum]|uniref:DUF1722 domain-containing protein n=1 Tax=Natronospirillum operosum TaxID=2759953 RepID=A0A4Z0WBM0_9GAMM|nr:DUF523 and DUF1722 domain-containing protein [Natronospirillum operosum]TGG95542.1 DUF1722 domain-containing protein [Natronospirillum operosum]
MTDSAQRPRIAVSACLLGEEVRYNGGHKRHRWLTDCLGDYVDFRPLCPEYEIGMGIPREPIRLVSRDGAVQAETHDGSKNFTDPLRRLADDYVPETEQWDGLILMQGSPSCGLFRVKLYDERGFPTNSTQGAFAGRLQSRSPLLPMEEAGRLNDSHLRENFLTRVFLRQRWRQSNPAQSAAALIDFHSRSKYLILAHSQSAYKTLGQLLSDLSQRDPAKVAREYQTRVAEALAHPAPRGQVTNVLLHIQGYLREHLRSEQRQSLREVIDKYQAGLVPMIVPLTLLQHHLDTHWKDDTYIRRQFFLNPYPEQLGLRNAV